jgi:hypothetical protein
VRGFRRRRRAQSPPLLSVGAASAAHPHHCAGLPPSWHEWASCKGPCFNPFQGSRPSPPRRTPCAPRGSIKYYRNAPGLFPPPWRIKPPAWSDVGRMLPRPPVNSAFAIIRPALAAVPACAASVFPDDAAAEFYNCSYKITPPSRPQEPRSRPPLPGP